MFYYKRFSTTGLDSSDNLRSDHRENSDEECCADSDALRTVTLVLGAAVGVCGVAVRRPAPLRVAVLRASGRFRRAVRAVIASPEKNAINFPNYEFLPTVLISNFCNC